MNFNRKEKVIGLLIGYMVLFGPLLLIFVQMRQVIPDFAFDLFELLFFPHLLVAYYCKYYFLYLKLWLSLFGLLETPTLFHDGFRGYFIDRFPVWRFILTGNPG